MKVERIYGDGGLKKSDSDDRYDSQEKKKVQMKRTPHLLQCIPDRPEKPEEEEQKNGMGGVGWDKKKGDEPPVFPLGDPGGVELQNSRETRGGQIEEPRTGIHGDQPTGEIGDGPTPEVLFESVGPASGAHAPGKPVRA